MSDMASLPPLSMAGASHVSPPKQTLRKRALPTTGAVTCGPGRYSIGRWCDRSTGRVDVWYDKCFAPMVVLSEADFEDESNAQDTRPAAGTASGDDGHSKIGDEIASELDLANNAYPSYMLGESGLSRTTVAGSPVGGGSRGAFYDAERGQDPYGTVDRAEHACPRGFACVQAFDVDAEPHVFCKSHAPRVDRRASIPMPLQDALVRDSTPSAQHGIGIGNDASAGSGEDSDAPPLPVSGYRWVEPHLAAGVFFEIDAAELIRGMPIVTRTPQTPTVIMRRMKLDLGPLSQLSPPPPPPREGQPAGTKADEKDDEAHATISVMLYDPETMQLVDLDGNHIGLHVEASVKTASGETIMKRTIVDTERESTPTPSFTAARSTAPGGEYRPGSDQADDRYAGLVLHRPNEWYAKCSEWFSEQTNFFLRGEHLELTWTVTLKQATAALLIELAKALGKLCWFLALGRLIFRQWNVEYFLRHMRGQHPWGEPGRHN